MGKIRDSGGRDCEFGVAFEEQKWDNYYDEALRRLGQEHQINRWWKISDEDTLDLIAELFPKDDLVSVIEPACGSGGTSLQLFNILNLSRLVLFDTSANALKFARSITDAKIASRVEFVKGSAFELPFSDGEFNLCWNVGVIEHYRSDLLVKMVKEMIRVTKPGGRVIVGIPNRRNIAVLKAYLLGTWVGRNILSWVPGYRFDTEILYGNRAVHRLLESVFTGTVERRYAGSCLWASAPDWVVNIVHKFSRCSRFSFLTFYIIDV